MFRRATIAGYRVEATGTGERSVLRQGHFFRDKRISKVDTLRLAIRYIKHLEQMMKNEQHMYRYGRGWPGTGETGKKNRSGQMI